jgi:hypothetical protein
MEMVSAPFTVARPPPAMPKTERPAVSVKLWETSQPVLSYRTLGWGPSRSPFVKENSCVKPSLDSTKATSSALSGTEAT